MAYNIGDLKTEINSYILNHAAIGYIIKTNSVAPVGTSIDLIGSDFYIYKPIILVNDTWLNAGGGYTTLSVTCYLEREINGTWNRNNGQTRTSANGTSFHAYGWWAVNPGRYRLYMAATWTVIGGPPAPMFYMYAINDGLFGQTNYNAGSVYL
jgi:hypothetical protein